MKIPFSKCIPVIIILSLFINLKSHAQCTNADFEAGNTSGWSGSHGPCVSGFDANFKPINTCAPITGWAFINPGFNMGAVNAAPSATQDHFMMTSGFDASVGGSSLPVVCPLIPGNTTSFRLGNATSTFSCAQAITYSFTVNASTTSFTYYYAVVLDATSTHTIVQQPYFQIRMVAGTNDTIACASYDVNATTAPTIGGFTTNATISWKPWSSVTIPLQNYIGQTIKIIFEARHCAATPTGGSHWAYGYIDASCSPLQIIPSSPSVCSGQTDTLTAPSSAAYSWKGPSPGNHCFGRKLSESSRKFTRNLYGYPYPIWE